MDSNGGTITWYLVANDADFQATTSRVRREAKRTGKDVDREFSKGTKSASLSLEDFRRDLNKSAQVFRDFQIALRGFEMTSLILGATLAGGAIIELVAALTAASGAIVAVPGLIAPIVGAFATVKIATLGMSDAFKALAKGDVEKLAEAMKKLSPSAQEVVLAFGWIKKSFEPIQRDIQQNFFDGLGKQMRNVAETSFPVLDAGLNNIAKSMNGLLKETANVMIQPFFQGALENSLKATSGSITILTGAVDPLIRGLAGIINVGLPYSTMLADWIVKQSTVASSWINSAEGQRTLTEMINLGVQALQQLGSLIGAVTGLFFDLFKISNASGVSLIGTFTEMINKIREWLATEEGQARMKALFQAVDTVLRALLGVVGEFVNSVLGIVEAYNNLDGPLKSFVTNLLVFSAVASPVISYISAMAGSLSLIGKFGREAFQVLDFFAGGQIAAGLKGIAGGGGLVNKVFGLIAKNPLMVALGILVGVLVYLGTQTTIFQDAWKQLQPVFEATWKALQPLFKVLEELAAVLGGAIAKIMPVLAEVFGQILVALLPLIPPLLQLVITLLPVLVTIIKALISVIEFLIPIITVAAQIFGTVLVVAINVVVGVLQVVIGVIQAVADAFVAAWNGIVFVWNLAAAYFRGVWDAIVFIFTIVGLFFTEVFRAAWDGIKAIWNGAANFFSNIGNGIVNIFNNAMNGIRNAFNNAVNFVRGIPGSILGALGNLGGLLWNAGWDMIQGLVNGISNARGAVVNKIIEIARGALSAIKSFFGIRSPSKVMAQMGTYLMQGFEGGIEATGNAVVSAAETVADGVLGAFSGMQGTVSNIQSDFAVNGAMTSNLAPAVVDPTTLGATTASGVVINQQNNNYTEYDINKINKDLAWELR